MLMSEAGAGHRRRPDLSFRRCRSRGTTRPGSAIARSSSCAPTRTSRSAPGRRFPTRTIRSTAPSRGAGCTIPTRSTCPSTARWISSAGRGGTRRASTARPSMENAELRNFREKHSRTPVQSDRPAARADRQLLRHDLADRPQRRPHPGRARHSTAWPKNTLVVYSTDHGDWLGDHGLILKGPMAYEGLLRVGLLMRGPGMPAGQGGDTTPVSTIDLPATFADYAGVSLADARHSRSLKPLIEQGRLARLRLQRMGPAGLALRRRPAGSSTVRTRTHKLTLETNSGAGELYDLVNDPQEMDNRFGDPGVRAVRSELDGHDREPPERQDRAAAPDRHGLAPCRACADARLPADRERSARNDRSPCRDVAGRADPLRRRLRAGRDVGRLGRIGRGRAARRRSARPCWSENRPGA